MNAKALVGLVRSRLQYMRDWPDFVRSAESDWGGVPQHERVFDLSALMADENREVITDYATCGRNLPFPMMAMVGQGHGVFIVCGSDEGFYCYCYTAPVPIVFVSFTATGWEYVGLLRRNGGEVERIPGSDPRVKQFAEAVAMVLTLTTQACDDTRRIVSYKLTRSERRGAARDAGGDLHALDDLVVHRVCLDSREKRGWIAKRGATVVPTPKRLHEVRAHWRHLASGLVVRVRAHHRGQGGAPLPRVYTAQPASRSGG